MSEVPIKVTDFFELPSKCFRIFNLDPIENKFQVVDKTGRQKVLEVSKKICVLTFTCSVVLYFILIIMHAILKGKNFYELMAVLPTILRIPATCGRAFSILTNRETIIDASNIVSSLLSQTWDDWKYLCWYKVEKRLKLCSIIAKSLLALVSFFVASYGLQPAFEYLDSNKLLLATEIWLPFVTTDARIFTFVYIWEWVTSAGLSVFLMGCDLLLYALLHLITLQFDILASKIKAININEQSLRRNIAHLIAQHDMLLRTSDKIQMAFAPMHFFIFLGHRFGLLVWIRNCNYL